MWAPIQLDARSLIGFFRVNFGAPILLDSDICL